MTAVVMRLQASDLRVFCRVGMVSQQVLLGKTTAKRPRGHLVTKYRVDRKKVFLRSRNL